MYSAGEYKEGPGGATGMYIIQPGKEKKSCLRCSFCLCISLVVFLMILVAGLGYGIHKAIEHFDESDSEESKQNLSTSSPINQNIESSRVVDLSKQISSTQTIKQKTESSWSIDIDFSTSISPSSTVVGQTSSATENVIVVSSWTRWQGWESCSTSCGGGVQIRRRVCGNPGGLPSHQLMCYGKESQSRNCSEWKCPDCDRNCTIGKLNSACDACICTNNTFSGRVKNQNGVPLDNVTIALAEFPFNILARTNIAGFFKVEGICVSNEKILLDRNGYSSQTITATQINPTKAEVQVTLTRIVFPDVIVHPENKLRFEGDNVTFCCKANGKPYPQYEWVINDRSTDEFQNDGADGSNLIISNVIKNMSGEVKCRAYNDYGAEFSNIATLNVLDRAPDSCSSTPIQNLTPLPTGCIHLNTNSTIIDAGECSKEKCIGEHLNQGNTCRDKNYCCQSKTTEEIQIRCASVISINFTRITSCGCTECFTQKSKIRGVAKGRKENIPFVLGSIFSADGKRLARTGRDGSFAFDVPDGTTRLVVTFKDDYNYNDFYELTKVIPFQIGQETFVNVRLRSRPSPVTINATEGFEIPLGGNTTQPAFAAISMPPQGLMNDDGETYNGTAKVTVDWLDPRNDSEIEEADGEFTTVGEDGEEQLLETFGVMKIDFKDENGKKLEPNDDIDVLFDPEIFNMTTDEAKAVQLWFMDEKTGRWRAINSGLAESRPRRSKRSNRLFFFGTIKRDQYQITNFDKRIASPCYIKVYVNNLKGARVTVAVTTTTLGNQYGDNYLNGNENCIRVYCKAKKITLLAMHNGVHLIPQLYNVAKATIRNHKIEIFSNKSNAFVNRITMKVDTNNIEPPFYSTWTTCKAYKNTPGFAFIKQEASSRFENKLELKVEKPPKQRDKKYWYEQPGVCFIKLGFHSRSWASCKQQESYFHVESFIQENSKLVSTGYTMVSSMNGTAVCAEFKCSLSDVNVNVSITSLTTLVTAYHYSSVLEDLKSVWEVTKKKYHAYTFNIYPKYGVSIPEGGIVRSDVAIDDAEKLSANKTFIFNECHKDHVKPAVMFHCH